MYQELDIVFHPYGNPDGPLMVAVHGIMGSSRDFKPFIEKWGETHRLLIPDLLAGSPTRAQYFSGEDGEGELAYDKAPQAIVNLLQRDFPGEKVNLVGISYGGKICFEVGRLAPELVRTIHATDVGFGPLCTDSELFRLVFDVLPSLNLEQPWIALRRDIASKIPDRMLRVLLHNHIEYSEADRSVGKWKPGTKNFHILISGSKLESQWPENSELSYPVGILQATVNSAISKGDLGRLRELSGVEVEVLEGANHFIHVHFPDRFREWVCAGI